MNRITSSLRGLQAIILVVSIAGFTLLFVQGFMALRSLESAAVQMGDGKDIVADILPPPLYVIETHLIAHQLLDAPLAERNAIAAPLKQLRQDYLARNTYWQEKGSAVDGAVAASLLGAQKGQGEKYWERMENAFLPAVLAGRDEEARKVFGELKSLYAAHRTGVDATVKLASAWADERLADLSATARHTLWILAVVATLCVGAMILLGLIVSRRIGRLLGAEPERLREEMARLAAGDLKPSNRSCAADSVLGALRNAQERIRTLVEQTRHESGTVDQQVAQVCGSLGYMETNAGQLADATHSVSSAMEEITASMAMIVEQIGQVESAVASAGEGVERGMAARGRNLACVDRIATASTQAQGSVSLLGERSQEVTGIVQTIRSIAEQTNLLALNAAIEAARAGEQGRGFAVVADEVRKLAERTTTATEEIAALIGTIQTGIAQAVDTINVSVADVESGRQSAEESGAALDAIHSRIGSVRDAVADIVSAAREINTATGQINDSMASASALAETESASAREAAAAGTHLGEVSVRLKQALSAFSV